MHLDCKYWLVVYTRESASSELCGQQQLRAHEATTARRAWLLTLASSCSLVRRSLASSSVSAGFSSDMPIKFDV